MKVKSLDDAAQVLSDAKTQLALWSTKPKNFQRVINVPEIEKLVEALEYVLDREGYEV